MNTYIRSTYSREYAAIRAHHTRVKALGLEIVPATPKLRYMARIGVIATFRILPNNTLGHL
jgi:hypothetical protein